MIHNLHVIAISWYSRDNTGEALHRDAAMGEILLHRKASMTNMLGQASALPIVQATLPCPSDFVLGSSLVQLLSIFNPSLPLLFF